MYKLGQWRLHAKDNKIFFAILKILWLLRERPICFQSFYKRMGVSRGVALTALKINYEMGNVVLENKYIKITEKGKQFIDMYSDYYIRLVEEGRFY